MTDNNNNKTNFMEPEMTRSTFSSKNTKTILFPITISQLTSLLNFKLRITKLLQIGANEKQCKCN